MEKYLALLLPVFFDLLVSKFEDSRVKFLVTFFLCTVIGAGLSYLETNFVFMNAKMIAESIVETTLMVFGLTQISYNLGYKDSSIRKTMLKELNK